MAGIFNSHMQVLKKIIDEDIYRCIIFQDDAILQWDLFQQLRGCKEVFEADTMVFLTGTIFPPNNTDLDRVFRKKELRDKQYQDVLDSYGPETNPPRYIFDNVTCFKFNSTTIVGYIFIFYGCN